MFIEISNLTETLNIDNDSVFPLVYQGQTKKTTLNSLKEALNYFTSISYNKTTGQFIFTKVNNEDVGLSTDLNTSIKNVSLNNGILTFTQQDNTTIDIDISIVDGTITKAKLAQALQNEIDAKYVKPSGGIPKTDLSSAVQTSLGKADSALQEHQDISGKEDKTNKVTSIDDESTDTQYPSAKLLYDELAEKQDEIDALVEENSTLKKQISTAHISTTSTQLTDSAEDLPIENVKLKMQTSQVTDEYVYICDGTETGDYYFEYNNTNYQFTMPTISEGDALVFDGTKLTLDETEITTTTDNTGTLITLQQTPNPAYPQLIHRVTGNCKAVVGNKNEFVIDDFYENCITVRCTKETIDNGIRLNFSNNSIPYVGETVSVGNIASQTIQNMMQRIDGNINYTISSSSMFLKCYITFFDKNYKSLQRKDMINISSLTFTTPENAEYFCLRLGLAEIDTASITSYDYTNIQLEKASIATDYIPHAEQNAPLSLGNTELYEDDEIEIDYVQKAGYKKVTGARKIQKMRKLVLNGTESGWTKETNFFQYGGALGAVTGAGLSNYYVYASTGNNTFYLTTNNLRIRDNAYDTLEGYLSWLSTHNLEIVYELVTPVTIPITDSTLLAQLETLINMKTYKNITNIESTGADLAPVIEFDYYQDMSTLSSNRAIRRIGGNLL